MIIGTCSVCGGPVRQVDMWMGTKAPPPPECERCGAVRFPAYGPVIEMKPKAKPLPPEEDR